MEVRNLSWRVGESLVNLCWENPKPPASLLPSRREDAKVHSQSVAGFIIFIIEGQRHLPSFAQTAFPWMLTDNVIIIIIGTAY